MIKDNKVNNVMQVRYIQSESSYQSYSPYLHIWKPESLQDGEIESSQLRLRIRGIMMLRNVLMRDEKMTWPCLGLEKINFYVI